jgi:hypothetical protein
MKGLRSIRVSPEESNLIPNGRVATRDDKKAASALMNFANPKWKDKRTGKHPSDCCDEIPG